MTKLKCTNPDCSKWNLVVEAQEDSHCEECQSKLQLSEAGTPGPIRRRIVVGAIATVIVLAVSGLAFFLTRTDPPPASAVKAPLASGKQTGSGPKPDEKEIDKLRREGQAKLTSGDPAAAADASKRAASLEIIKVAIAYLSQGKLAEAEKELRDARERDPSEPLVHYNMAVLRIKQGKLDDALAELETSFAKGFKAYDAMTADSDLDALRKHPRFDATLKKYGR